MKIAGKLVFLIALVLSLTLMTFSQWRKQSVNTTASLRGLSVVNERVVWASGTGGTVIKTADGGARWKVMTVPGAEKLDFRDIEAFDANTAYILSIGNGENSRIYKTTDGGETWELQFKNTNEKAFFDAIACWDAKNCITMSDPVDGRFIIMSTINGGKNWGTHGKDVLPTAIDGEAAFAASGTCLITHAKQTVYMVSGGSQARVFRSDNSGATWYTITTEMAKGTPGSGIFSIAIHDAKTGVLVGGNYEKPDEAKNNLAFTSYGLSWKLGTGLTGYRSGVTYVDKKTIIAVGTNGSDISRDGGKTWKILGEEDLNAVQAKSKKAVWAVGTKGLVVKMK